MINKPKKGLHGDYWIKISSDLPNTTTCVKLTSGKAKIRMLKDEKLVKRKSNHEMIKRSKQENSHVNRQNADKQWPTEWINTN